MSDSFWNGSANGSALDLSAFLDSRVTDGIGQLVSLGVLVSLGISRDGGALGITVFDNGRKRREWFRHSEECADWLTAAFAALSGNGVGVTASSPSPSQKPTRGR